MPARGDGSQACIPGNAGNREDLPGAKGRQWIPPVCRPVRKVSPGST